MNATIGIYDNHELVVDAVQKLKDSGYPMTNLTIMGGSQSEVIDEEMRIMAKNPLNVVGLGAGTAIGVSLGVLTGVGLLAIPGLGVLFGAGALVGAIAGFDFGLIGGGIASVLATIGVKDENAEKYHDALAEGKFLLIVHGNEADVNEAKRLLDTYGTHTDMAFH